MVFMVLHGVWSSLVLVLLFVARHSAYVSRSGRRHVGVRLHLRLGVGVDVSMETGLGVDSMSDILSKDVLEAANMRVNTLMAIFGPSLSQAKMNAIATRFPMLLYMEEEKITQAFDTIQRETPFVDPAFLLKQRALGIELLVTCVGSERYTPTNCCAYRYTSCCTLPSPSPSPSLIWLNRFNLTEQFEEISDFFVEAHRHKEEACVEGRGGDQGDGSATDCDTDGDGDADTDTEMGANSAMTPVEEARDLVRRAPHVLAPRFKAALYDHVTVLGEVRLRPSHNHMTPLPTGS